MKELVEKAELFVTDHVKNHLDRTYVYHNIAHTQRVVNSTLELIENEDLSEDDASSLIIAAWFHDIGYTDNSTNHEDISAEYAKRFLTEEGVDEKHIDTVSQLILSTKMGYEPKNELEEIIRDADNSHFGKKSYFDIAELLRKEWELSGNKTYTDLEWLQENINFFNHHHRFYRHYSLKNWQKRKDKNLSELLKDEKKLRQEQNKLAHKRDELAFKKNKVKLPERGIETMFRVALRNHITLSDIADTKANILLSVNAIIISVALSNLLPKLDNPSNQYLIYPTLIFLFFTVVSIVLSVLATRPNVTKGKFSKEDVNNKKVNLLFFGNFHQMQLDEFEWAMNEMMQDRDYLYSSLTKDLYFLGLVLNKKYNLLRLTYAVFMIGIIVSVAAFAVAFHIQATNAA